MESTGRLVDENRNAIKEAGGCLVIHFKSISGRRSIDSGVLPVVVAATRLLFGCRVGRPAPAVNSCPWRVHCRSRFHYFSDGLGIAIVKGEMKTAGWIAMEGDRIDGKP